MKKRIEWIDLVKYICIMFVMLSHLESCTEAMGKFFLPFFLNGFFFVSGYVYRNPLSFKIHMRKKFKGLFVPWFIFSNLNIFLSSIISLKGNRDIKSEILMNLLQIRGYGDGIWFVAALFMAFIPFYFVVKLNNSIISILLSFILAISSSIYIKFFPKDYYLWGSNSLPWHMEYIFIAMFWMILGYYYKQQYEKDLARFDKWYYTLLILLIYLAVVYCPIKIQQPIIAILFSYTTSILGVAVVILISKHIKTNIYFSYVGSNTIIYFALHGKLYAVIEWFLARWVGSYYYKCLSNLFYSSFIAMLITIFMSVVLIIPTYCINRWLPWMVGRNELVKK